MKKNLEKILKGIKKGVMLRQTNRKEFCLFFNSKSSSFKGGGRYLISHLLSGDVYE